jgi:hypothetical protein
MYCESLRDLRFLDGDWYSRDVEITVTPDLWSESAEDPEINEFRCERCPIAKALRIADPSHNWRVGDMEAWVVGAHEMPTKRLSSAAVDLIQCFDTGCPLPSATSLEAFA